MIGSQSNGTMIDNQVEGWPGFRIVSLNFFTARLALSQIFWKQSPLKTSMTELVICQCLENNSLPETF
jgi:hypothetical protein